VFASRFYCVSINQLRNITESFMTDLITLEGLQKALPSKKNTITQESVNIINISRTEPEFQGESLLKSAITYESVLSRNRASIAEYLQAIRFCAYLTTNEESTFIEAYGKVFSEREFVKKRVGHKSKTTQYIELSSAASRYRRSKLVIDILTVSQVPLDLMFTGYRYKAIGVLADVMENGRFDRDRVAAAKELLAATKGPENVKIELDLGVKESSAVQQMNDQLVLLAARQRERLESGASTLEEFGSMKVVDSDVIDGEFTSES